MGDNSSVEQAKPGRIDVWLDPQEALEIFQAEVDNFAALDPNIAAVQKALNARFEEIPEEDTIRVMAVIWPQVKAILSSDLSPRGLPGFPQPGFPPSWPPSWPSWPPSWPPWPSDPSQPPWFWFGSLINGSAPRSITALRHGLVEGEALRNRIQEDLDGPLSADALRNTAKQIQEWEHASTSAQTREFDMARDELERLITGPERKIPGVPVALVLVGAVAFGLALGAGIYVATHPT